MAKAFSDVIFVESVEREKHEHEVFMSFNNDSDAVYFHEWWDEAGAGQFAAFVKKMKASDRRE